MCEESLGQLHEGKPAGLEEKKKNHGVRSPGIESGTNLLNCQCPVVFHERCLALSMLHFM